jgi:hypothetical protein
MLQTSSMLVTECKYVYGKDACAPSSCFAKQGTSVYVVNVTGYTGGPDAWNNYPSQKSYPVGLQAGQVVLLEAAHCQSPAVLSVLQVRCQGHRIPCITHVCGGVYQPLLCHLS